MADKKEKIRKTDTKQQEPEAQESKVDSLDVFQQVKSMWEIAQPAQLRAEVARLFQLADEQGACRENIAIEELYQCLKHVHDARFNQTQTRVFVQIMQRLWFAMGCTELQNLPTGLTLEERQCDKTIESVFDLFKQLLLNHTVSGEEEVVDFDSVELDKRKEEEEKQKTAKGKQKKITNDKSDDIKEEAPQKVFTQVFARSITDYVTSTLFAHFNLFATVWDANFTPEAVQEHIACYTDSVIVDSTFDLANAMLASEWEQKQQEEKLAQAALEQQTQQQIESESNESNENTIVESAPAISDDSDPLQQMKAEMDRKLEEHRKQMEQMLADFAKK